MKDHQWLGYMDRFSSGIFIFKPDNYIKSVPDLPAELRRDVRICLIDDAVDISHKGIMKRIEDRGRALGRTPETSTVEWRGPSMTRRQFIAHPDEDNSEDITHIKNALGRTTAEKKLIFCSAPDTGDMSPDELSSYFPVGSGIPDLFRIGAAKADNTPWPQAGGRNVVDYVLSGHDVREKNGYEVVQNDPSLNAHGAIRTYEVGNQTSKEANIIKLNSLKTIKLPTTMRKTFDGMTANKTYVHVWSDF
ncbi:hypothetical protein F4824DRAFT_495297 [Ustulina deusta]|nr:hypothetical protein F4824DRAFT_495297 [Ustulina deusta]